MGRAMFARKDVITEAVAAAYAVVARFERGDVIPWHLIESAAGFARGSTHWSAFLARLRRDVRGDAAGGLVLEAVPNVGLKVLTPTEQLRDQVEKRQRRAARQIHRGLTDLAALPAAELTGRQKEEKARRIDIGRAGLRSVRRMKRLADALHRNPARPYQPANG